jgi:hypothetical protein
LRGVTTSASSDERLRDTGLQQTADFIRFDMGAFLRDRFKGKSVKVSGQPRTPNVGQSPIEINYEPAISATKVSLKRARQVTTKKGAYGTIGSAKGQPTTTGTISLAVPKAGLEIKLPQSDSCRPLESTT